MKLYAEKTNSRPFSCDRHWRVYCVLSLGRIGSTLNPSALFFSILLLIGEIIGILDFYMFALMTWNTNEKRPLPPEEGLSVDVFIPTYDEDLSILEATVIGCLNMRYPHKTYLLDDGDRGEVKALAQSLVADT